MKGTRLEPIPGVVIQAPVKPENEEILTPEAVEFVAELHRKFNPTRVALLRERAERQKRIDQGEWPDFLPETAHIRSGDWKIAGIPADLQDRRVEITGPAGDRKMVINALNSGAKTYMADFEDANSPTWENSVGGQVNLRDAIRRTIRYTSPEGKEYRLNPEVAVLIARPRGWHLHEKHMLVDGEPVSASLFDFGLYFFHNAKYLLDHGSGPYFYLPKMQSHKEARLWNDVFVHAQQRLGIPQGSIKATVLIEHILAAFEMDEILYELREHIAGLNCGRWDYIFSYIKTLRNKPDVILPDRGLVTMTVPFMRAYTLLAIQTCHKRGAACIGGMAAQIPVKNDPKANEEAFEKVRLDKEREASDGHDGTWVAHPGLVPTAMEVFNRLMPTPNQIHKIPDVKITAEDLLRVPEGPITEAGLRININVGVRYIEAWLRGVGAVPIFNLMEDAATAEISRTQVWQWIRHPKGVLQDGRKVTKELVLQTLEEEMAKIRAEIGEEAYAKSRFELARSFFADLSTRDEFVEFLTVPGYEYLDWAKPTADWGHRAMRMRMREDYDVVVAGGGTAGAIAAIAAARTGARTLLVEQYGTVGGVVTLGMSFKGICDGEGSKALGGIGEELIERARRMGGATVVSPHPRHGSIMGQDPEAMKMALIEMIKESGLHLLLHSFLVDAMVDGGRIQAVTVANKSGLEVIPAKTFVDCTGDADLASLAGAEFVHGREGDAGFQPVSCIFRVGGVDLDKTWAYLKEHPEDFELPVSPGDDYEKIVESFRNTPGVGVEGFRSLIQKAREAGDYTIPRDKLGFNPFPGRREVTINITRLHGIDGTNPDDLTRAEIETQLQMLESVRFLRKYVPGFENCYVVSSPYQVGVRESRRIRGYYTMTKEDVLEGRNFDDQIARGAYPLDIHDVDRGGGVLLLTINRSYGIPARCLIPRGVDNLTVAGRAVSATHEAAGSLRGQPVCMATGHAAGTMAALAALRDLDVPLLPVREVQAVLRSQKAVIERETVGASGVAT